MNAFARVTGWLATCHARAMQRWAVTRCGAIDARASVFSSLLDLSDEPSLVGVTGKRRGSVPLSPADPVVALAFWRRCVGHWAFGELSRRRDLTSTNWSAAHTDAARRFARSGRG